MVKAQYTSAVMPKAVRLKTKRQKSLSQFSRWQHQPKNRLEILSLVRAEGSAQVF